MLCGEFKTKYEVKAEALLTKLIAHQSSSLLLSLPITVHCSTFIRLSLHVTVQKNSKHISS